MSLKRRNLLLHLVCSGTKSQYLNAGSIRLEIGWNMSTPHVRNEWCLVVCSNYEHTINSNSRSLWVSVVELSNCCMIIQLKESSANAVHIGKVLGRKFPVLEIFQCQKVMKEILIRLIRSPQWRQLDRIERTALNGKVSTFLKGTSCFHLIV